MSGLLGPVLQPGPNVGAPAIQSPDTAANRIAFDIHQLDPDAHVFRLRNAAGIEVLVSEQDGDLVISGQVQAAGGVVADSLELPAINGEGTALALGEVVQIDSAAAKTVRRALATAVATSDVLGCAVAAIASGAQGRVRHVGVVRMLLAAGLAGGDAPAADKEVYLSAATAGRATTIAPTGAGQFVVPLGTVWDAAQYGVDQTVLMMLEKGPITGA